MAANSDEDVVLIINPADHDEDMVLIINPADHDEDEMRESKYQSQNRNERMGFSHWGRISYGRVVTFIANLSFCCYFWRWLRRLLARIFGCLYDAFRDIEDQQELPPYVDPHF